MSCPFFEDLVASPEFSNLPKLNQFFFLETMLGPSPAETMSTGGDIASEGGAPEVVSMEALAPIPMVPRFPRLKSTHVRETQKSKKDKQNKSVLVHESPRKQCATQKQKKEK